MNFTKILYLLRYLLNISFDGSNYHGWQTQPESITIQETIENCLSQIIGERIKLVGAGRTDAGVHATIFYAHFDLKTNIQDKSSLVHKLNSFLPNDISVNNLYRVEDDFHARFDALSRTYQYKLTNLKNPFMKNRFYYLQKDLDFNMMNLASLNLLGKKNFKCFSKSRSDVKTYDCSIISAKWFKLDNHWVFEISADRFLRNMVRAIVGTLIDIGQEKNKITSLTELIRSGDRTKAGYSVPAHGLYLHHISYPVKSILYD